MLNFYKMGKNENGQQQLRLTITLSEFTGRKLICWAKARGKTKTAYAASLVEEGIEQNIGKIEALMEDIARYEGISLEELETKWLKDEGFKG